MKKKVLKNRYGKLFIKVFSSITIAAILLIIVQSCGKEDGPRPRTETRTTGQNAANATGTTITKKQALARLNETFKDQFSTITMQQVSGVTKQQFRNWLHNTVMAAAEDMYLKPLLQSDSLEYLIIKNVTVKENGKKANIGLIATTSNFYHQYTRLVSIIGYTNIPIGDKHICSWKRCDSYSACPCITWIDFRYGECPSDRCQDNYDCQGYNPATDCNGELTGIKTIEVIGAF